MRERERERERERDRERERERERPVFEINYFSQEYTSIKKTLHKQYMNIHTTKRTGNQ